MAKMDKAKLDKTGKDKTRTDKTGKEMTRKERKGHGNTSREVRNLEFFRPDVPKIPMTSLRYFAICRRFSKTVGN